MKDVFGYIGTYFQYVNKKLLILCSLQTAILIYLNYHNELESWLTTRPIFGWPSFVGHYIIFALAFWLPYLYCAVIEKKLFFRNKQFLILTAIAPAVFALKMALHTTFPFSNNAGWNEYWNQVYYWPLRLVIVVAILVLLWKTFNSDESFYGLTTKNLKWKPYALMLLCMLPLIAAASTQADFLAMYPKINSVLHINDKIHLTWFHKFLFELSYGSDFFSIEIFFRGFLVLAFAKWAGKDAIHIGHGARIPLRIYLRLRVPKVGEGASDGEISER